VIVDTDARLPVGSNLVASAASVPVWVLCANDAAPARIAILQAAGVRTVQLPRAQGGIDIARGVAALGAAGIRSIFVEGGGAIARSLMTNGLVDRLHLFRSRAALPGGVLPFDPPLIDGLVGHQPAGSDTLVRTATQMFGDDECITFDSPEYA
jgi:diaminohydroxyphosphoribosylaminopyrimidine deaminase / 5-amino-6-(5-phosphoribosylamino)uracil reductase